MSNDIFGPILLGTVIYILQYFYIKHQEKKIKLSIEINNFDKNVRNVMDYFLFEIYCANYFWNDERINFFERLKKELDVEFENIKQSKLNNVDFISIWFSEPYKHYDTISDVLNLLPLEDVDCAELIFLDEYVKEKGKMKFEMVEIDKSVGYLPLPSQIENVYRFVKFMNDYSIKYRPDEFPKLKMMKYQLDLNEDLKNE